MGLECFAWGEAEPGLGGEGFARGGEGAGEDQELEAGGGGQGDGGAGGPDFQGDVFVGILEQGGGLDAGAVGQIGERGGGGVER